MIELLEPLVGSFATSIFAVGIIAAGVSSQFPNVLMLPWLLCDYNQSNAGDDPARYRIMVFLISLLGLVVPIFDARPVFRDDRVSGLPVRHPAGDRGLHIFISATVATDGRA